MAYGVFSVLVALLMAAAASAETTVTPFCHVTSSEYPMEFESLELTMEEYDQYAVGSLLDGFCRDYLGELCDDGIKCTADYDYEEAECLPEPRDVVDGCEEIQ